MEKLSIQQGKNVVIAPYFIFILFPEQFFDNYPFGKEKYKRVPQNLFTKGVVNPYVITAEFLLGKILHGCRQFPLNLRLNNQNHTPTCCK